MVIIVIIINEECRYEKILLIEDINNNIIQISYILISLSVNPSVGI